MTDEQRLDLLERLARSLAYPEFGEESRKREQQRKINVLLECQKRRAEALAKDLKSSKPNEDVEGK